MPCFWPQRTIACLRLHAYLPTCAGSLLAGSLLRCAACPLTQYGTRHRILRRASAGFECWRSHESLRGSIARLCRLRLGQCPQLPARQQPHVTFQPPRHSRSMLCDISAREHADLVGGRTVVLPAKAPVAYFLSRLLRHLLDQPIQNSRIACICILALSTDALIAGDLPAPLALALARAEDRSCCGMQK